MSSNFLQQQTTMAPLRTPSPDLEAAQALLKQHEQQQHSFSPTQSFILSDDASENPLLHCPSCNCSPKGTSNISLIRSKPFWLTYINIVLFISSILLFFTKAQQTSSSSSWLSPREAIKATSAYSPIFDAVDLSPKSTTVDGRLHSHANSSIFRGDPSPATDAAWDNLAAESHEVILIDSKTLQRAGYDPRHYFQAPLSWGYGEDKFPVQIDVFHQIHCLNAIRKQMNYEYYYAAEFPDGQPDEMHWMHQRHCLHMILQSLMCNANVDIVPHRWVEKDDKPFAEFSIQRQCRNFDNLFEWNEKNAIEDVRKIWPRTKDDMPEDAFVWPGFGEPM